jgi:hypothetical protein
MHTMTAMGINRNVASIYSCGTLLIEKSNRASSAIKKPSEIPIASATHKIALRTRYQLIDDFISNTLSNNHLLLKRQKKATSLHQHRFLAKKETPDISFIVLIPVLLNPQSAQ